MTIAAFTLWIALVVVSSFWAPNVWAIGWFSYLTFVALITSIRSEIRGKYDINGSVCEDFFASLLFYPNVAMQLEATSLVFCQDIGCANGGINHVEDEEDPIENIAAL